MCFLGNYRAHLGHVTVGTWCFLGSSLTQISVFVACMVLTFPKLRRGKNEGFGSLRERFEAEIQKRNKD